jgi:hypothetical protein
MTGPVCAEGVQGTLFDTPTPPDPARVRATQILDAARQSADRRAAAVERVPGTDYQALAKVHRKLSRQLTVAVSSGERHLVVLACYDAVTTWAQPGFMWPDNWHRWQAALDDVLGWCNDIQLADLAGAPAPGEVAA